MQNNVPSNSAKLTIVHIAKNNFKDAKLMECPLTSPIINSIENLLSFIKICVYKNRKQVNKISARVNIKRVETLIKSTVK